MNPSTLSISYFNEGFCWLNSNNIKDISINYYSALVQNPDYETENNLYAYEALHSSGYKKAIACFDKAIHLSPQFAMAYKYRGLAYENLEMYKEALSDLSRWTELEPFNAEAYHCKANVNAEIDEAASIKDFDKAIELNPEFIQAYNNRGRTYLSMKKRHLSNPDFEKSIQLCNKKLKEINIKDTVATISQVYFFRAWAKDKLGDKNAAIEDYNKAIELNPKHYGSYFFRGYLYYNNRQWADAVYDFLKATELNLSNAYSNYLVSACLLELDYLPEALEFVNLSLLLKETFLATFIKTNILLDMQDYKKAEMYYRKAQKLEPQHQFIQKTINFLSHYNRLNAQKSVSKLQLLGLKFHIFRYELKRRIDEVIKKINSEKSKHHS